MALITFTRAFWLPKKGNDKKEYEDAFDYSIPSRRFAIADGATESSFSDRWAQILVQGFTALPLCQYPSSSQDLQNWLKPLQRNWNKSIDWEKLPWFSVEKAKMGAFSSLLGLVFIHNECIKPKSSANITDEDFCHWYAVAIGDSCLFQVRNGVLLVAFPIKCSERFNNRPFLLSSDPSMNQNVRKQFRFDEGNCQSGDTFFLATDALAQWILTQHESGNKPWKILCAMDKEEAFADMIADLRQNNSIKNDDVTLLIVHFNCTRC